GCLQVVGRLADDRDASALVGGLLDRDVHVDRAPEIDDAEEQQEEDGRDESELRQALRALALEKSRRQAAHLGASLDREVSVRGGMDAAGGLQLLLHEA